MNGLHDDKILYPLAETTGISEEYNMHFKDLWGPISLVLGGWQLSLLSVSYVTEQNRLYMKTANKTKFNSKNCCCNSFAKQETQW